MTAKQILFDTNARKRIANGLDILANAVKVWKRRCLRPNGTKAGN